MPLKPLAPPPIRQPLTSQNGTLNLAWVKWLNEVHNKANKFPGQLFQAARVSFIGRATNGAVAVYSGSEYNMTSLERVSTGVYEGVITQQTAYGANLLDNAVGVITHDVSDSGTTEIIRCKFSVVDSTTFRVTVYEVVQGAASSLDLVLYDPDETGDVIEVSIHSTISTELPPP